MSLARCEDLFFRQRGSTAKFTVSKNRDHPPQEGDRDVIDTTSLPSRDHPPEEKGDRNLIDTFLPIKCAPLQAVLTMQASVASLHAVLELLERGQEPACKVLYVPA